MTAPPPGFRSRVDGRRIRSLLSMRQFIGEAQNPRTVWALGGSRLTGRSRGRRFKSGQPDGENPCTGGCRMDGRRAGAGPQGGRPRPAEPQARSAHHGATRHELHRRRPHEGQLRRHGAHSGRSVGGGTRRCRLGRGEGSVRRRDELTGPCVNHTRFGCRRRTRACPCLSSK